MNQRANGQYFTTENPFKHPAFLKWAESCHLKKRSVLEPFAGANHIISHLEVLDIINNSISYDLNPKNSKVKYRNTIEDFPTGYSACITNPPWLAKNSATIRNLPFPETKYNDLYKVCLDLCLSNCEWVAVLVPESFIRSNQFTERLSSFISITRPIFTDTDHPTGLALFQPSSVGDTEIWSGNKYVGTLSELMKYRYKSKDNGVDVKFNVKDGNVGLRTLDNTKEDSIRFCDIKEIQDRPVKSTDRFISQVRVDGEVDWRKWNRILKKIRKNTSDVVLTACKGLRFDGKYRRRLDFDLARGIIHHAA